MLNAIKHNKVDRALFKGNEDSLTSTVFEKVNYLPRELFKRIFLESLSELTNFPEIDFNTLENIEYWPHWDSAETTNASYVEPDVFLRFKDHDIIIEAKRWDTEQQYSGQWENEINAYLNEYGEDNKQLVFVAVGGIWECTCSTVELRRSDEKQHAQSIYKCKWSSILKSVKKALQQIEPVKTLTSANSAVAVILQDIVTAFALFGFSTADWFDEFSYERGIRSQSIELTLNWRPTQNG